MANFFPSWKFVPTEAWDNYFKSTYGWPSTIIPFAAYADWNWLVPNRGESFNTFSAKESGAFTTPFQETAYGETKEGLIDEIFFYEGTFAKNPYGVEGSRSKFCIYQMANRPGVAIWLDGLTEVLRDGKWEETFGFDGSVHNDSNNGDSIPKAIRTTFLGGKRNSAAIEIYVARNTFRATRCKLQFTMRSVGYHEQTFDITNSEIAKYWRWFKDLRIEFTASSLTPTDLPITILKNGTPIASGPVPLSVSVEDFNDGDVFEAVGPEAKALYIPLFADLHTASLRPLFSNINNPNFKPLFRGFKLPSQFLSYSFKSRAHLWTRISDSYSNTANALSDAYFPGRDSHYDGSSGDSGQNIQVNLSLLYAHPSATENTDGTKSITLYFFCALCNWGCTSDYESGTVDFKVLQKTFSVANIPRATSNDPGPGNEPLVFSFTITIRKNGNRYLATAVSITDKDGNTY